MLVFKYEIEKKLFGVCSYIGKKMGINSNRVRLYFIYASCLTLGSPFILYLIAAFWINAKKYSQEKKSTFLEL